MDERSCERSTTTNLRWSVPYEWKEQALSRISMVAADDDPTLLFKILQRFATILTAVEESKRRGRSRKGEQEQRPQRPVGERKEDSAKSWKKQSGGPGGHRAEGVVESPISERGRKGGCYKLRADEEQGQFEPGVSRITKKNISKAPHRKNEYRATIA